MPRQFDDHPIDRFMLEEEGDVTEVYFVMEGRWAVAFDTFAKSEAASQCVEGEDDELFGTKDMLNRGILCAMKKANYGYFGDYYVLASKRSQFYYVALSRVSAFALSQQFIFKTLFRKFPGLH